MGKRNLIPLNLIRDVPQTRVVRAASFDTVTGRMVRSLLREPDASLLYWPQTGNIEASRSPLPGLHLVLPLDKNSDQLAQAHRYERRPLLIELGRLESSTRQSLRGYIRICIVRRYRILRPERGGGCFAKDYRLGTGRTGQILIRHANIFHTPTWMEEWKRKGGPGQIRAVGFRRLAEGAGSQITTVVRAHRREEGEKSVGVINSYHEKRGLVAFGKAITTGSVDRL